MTEAQLHNPSTLVNLAGPHAVATANLFWYFLAVDAVIWVAVLAFLFRSIYKRRELELVEPISTQPEMEQRLKIGVGIAIGVTILILTGFLGLSYAVDKKLVNFDKKPELEIEITGHQWWWEIRYPGKIPSDTFVTANEIHVPVNTAVKLTLKSSDVIHSVWLPNMAGKRDIIPGHDEDLVIRADHEGIWQGRCAEYCGLQHANMDLKIFAEPKPVFEAWEKAQREPAAEPQTLEEKYGREIFNHGACAMCHAIRTTDSMNYSNNAPDLTHLKSRTTIGAGAAPNTKGDLGGWILDPHGAKPGVHMPAIHQEPKDFQALLNYLETLK